MVYVLGQGSRYESNPPAWTRRVESGLQGERGYVPLRLFGVTKPDPLKVMRLISIYNIVECLSQTHLSRHDVPMLTLRQL